VSIEDHRDEKESLHLGRLSRGRILVPESDDLRDEVVKNENITYLFLYFEPQILE
jgi:hypothetical protein